MEAIRFKSWSYIVICSLYIYMESYVHLLVVLMCNLMCSLICASSYVTLLFLCASSDSYGRRAELARTALFPTPCGWTTMRKFAAASRRRRTSILFAKRCFRMRSMSLTSICNIMLLVGFFESSKSHLSSDPRDRRCSSTEEL